LERRKQWGVVRKRGVFQTLLIKFLDKLMGLSFSSIGFSNGRIKNIFEIERFSGKSLLSIKQDFYGVIFLPTIESILNKPVQDKLSTTKELNHCTNPITVNRSQSYVSLYVSLIDHVVELLIDPSFSASQTLAKLEFLFSTNPTRHRPERTFPRNKGGNLQEFLGIERSKVNS